MNSFTVLLEEGPIYAFQPIFWFMYKWLIHKMIYVLSNNKITCSLWQGQRKKNDKYVHETRSILQKGSKFSMDYSLAELYWNKNNASNPVLWMSPEMHWSHWSHWDMQGPTISSDLALNFKSSLSFYSQALMPKNKQKENDVSVPQVFLKEITSGLTLLSLG